MRMQIGIKRLPFTFAAIVLFMFTPRACGLNYSNCALTVTNMYLDNPNALELRDQNGNPTNNFSNAWGISYHTCRALCSTDENASHSSYNWNYLAQGVSSWVLPWLALTAQLPFETRDKTTSLMALLLAVGSPSLLTYSLAITILQARWTNQVFRQIVEKSGPLRRDSLINAIRAARAILMELQHIPIGVCNGPRREIAQLVARPENWTWWCELRQGILKTKGEWTYSLYAQVGWVGVAQLLAIITFFTSLSTDWSTSIGIGLAINCLWLWMIPVVLGWVYVGTQTSAGSVKVALTEATVPALGSDRNVNGDCFGIRDRTTFDRFDISHQYSSAVNDDQEEESPSQDSTLRPQEFLPDGNVTETASTLMQAQTSSKTAGYRISGPIQQESPAETADVFFTGQAGDIKMRKLSKDSHLSTITTLRPIEEARERFLGGDNYFRFLPKTYMGFSIAGDELEPGPIFTYARPWTHANAVKHIAGAFRQLIVRQRMREPVARGRKWDLDPDNWKENLQGSPEEYSKYINPGGKDVVDFSIHAPASADLNCVIAAFVAVFLQWGTTGAAIVIAYETPVIGLGCQSGSYLIYGLCSTVSWLLLMASAYFSHRYFLRLEAKQRPSPYLGPIAVLLRMLGKTLAAANALFIVTNSFVQFTGLLDNCWCDASIPTLGKTGGWVILFATDVQIAAAGKAAWKRGASLGMVVVALVTAWIFIANRTYLSAQIMISMVDTQSSAIMDGQKEFKTTTELDESPVSDRTCGCVSCLELGSSMPEINGTLTCRVDNCNRSGLAHGEILDHEKEHFWCPGGYRCAEALCNASFERWLDLKSHYAHKHCKEREKFPCLFPSCKYSGENGFLRKDKLKTHYKKAHKGFKLPKNKGGPTALKIEPAKTYDPHLSRSDGPPSWMQHQGLGTSNNASPSGYCSDGEGSFFNKAHSAMTPPGSYRASSETANWPASCNGLTHPLSVNEPGISIDTQSGAADDEHLSTNGSKSLVDKSRSIVDDGTETLSPHHVSDGAVTFHPFANSGLPAYRSEWQCHCGFKSFDDFTSLQFDAVVEYHRSLQSCFSVHKIAPIGRAGQPSSEGRSIIGTVLENMRSWLRKEDHLLLHQNKKTQPGGSVEWIPPSLPPPAASPQPLYLLLCIQHQRFTTKLLQPDLTGLDSDRRFFKLLGDSYDDMKGRWRRRFSLKTLRGIKFVQFELHQPDLVDVQRENELPPEERRNEYHYAPMPPKIMPPVGEKLMLHFCTSPHCAAERGILLNRIPKKMKERLRACPTKGTSEGWGVYILEDWHVSMITILAYAILLLGSLVFFICWSVLKHDLQGASGIAMYIMAFIGLGIASLQAAFEL